MLFGSRNCEQINGKSVSQTASRKDDLSNYYRLVNAYEVKAVLYKYTCEALTLVIGLTNM